MSQDTKRLFKVWNMGVSTHWTPTRLFAHRLIDVGTPYINSLCSYVAELAQLHSLSTADLFKFIIVPEINSRFGKAGADYDKRGAAKIAMLSITLGGINTVTQEVIEVLESLTGQNNLSFATMLTWTSVLPAKGLMKDNHSWCACCYEEQRQRQEQAHDCLAWSLLPVRLCLKHNRLLDECCPYEDCGRTFRRLTTFYSPGYCPYCNRWLGIDTDCGSKDEHAATASPDWARMQFDAQVVSELIAVAPTLSAMPAQSNLIEGVTACIDRFADGGISTFAKQVTLVRGGIYALLKGERLLSIDQLLTLAYRTGVSLPELLIHGNVKTVTEPHPFIENKKPSGKTSHRYDAAARAELKEKFEAMLKREPPISFLQASEELGCNNVTLYYHFPEICQKIVERFEDYERRRSDEEYNAIKYGLEELLRYEDQTALPVSQICEHLARSVPHVRRHFPELCREISARYRASQREKGKARRNDLYQKIEDAVHFLHSQGRYPTANLVASIAGIGTAAFRDPGALEAWKNILRNLGYDIPR